MKGFKIDEFRLHWIAAPSEKKCFYIISTGCFEYKLRITAKPKSSTKEEQKMSHVSNLCKFTYTTKSRGVETTERWQFDRSVEGLLEAIRIFGALRLTDFINKFLSQDAHDELQRGSIPEGKEEQK